MSVHDAHCELVTKNVDHSQHYMLK